MHNNMVDPLLTYSLDIPFFNDLEEFAILTGLSTKLIYLLSNKSYRYYKVREIPKRNGSKRTIYVPSYTMKIIQRWILVNIISKLKPSENAMAFIKGKSTEYKRDIKTNAVYHSSSLYGLSIDLQDFFPSIKSKQVYYLFKKIGYNNFAATLLTKLCTLNDELPQGAVCSPALSNLICINLDSRLSGLCSKRRIVYTRYADDMYFSCDNKVLLLRLYPIIEDIIKDEGFEINQQKVHYHTPHNKKLVTGVAVVNNKGNVELKACKDLKRKIRAEIFRCVMTGSYDDVQHIKGEIAYVDYIQRENKKRYRDSIIEYINKLTDKIVYFPELVDAYNANLFFKELRPIEYSPISDLQLDMDKSDQNYDDTLFSVIVGLYRERIEYLKRHNLHDICQYEEWPDFSSFNESLYDESDLPY